MLKTITFSNYKGLSNRPVSLGRFNVLIGANAAGKTNFVDGFRFIHNVLDTGLSNAVGRRLGWENLLSREKRKTEKIAVEILYDITDLKEPLEMDDKIYAPVYIKYRLEAGCSAKRVYVNSESFDAGFKSTGKQVKETFERSGSTVKIHSAISSREYPKSISVPRQLRDKPFLQGGFLLFGTFLLSELINSWRFYDLDVNAARSPCLDEGQNVLLDDGRNLAAILDRLKTSSSRRVRERILSIMSILIPGFRKWEIERQFDGSLGFKIYEKGVTKAFLPKMLSDGTVRLLSMLLALLYQPSEPALICIDEPERYLHPQVLKPLVEIMRDVSTRTQVIVTTHSTELVRWLKPSEVFMVDKINKMTEIVRAENVSMIDKFMEDFSLDELWLGGYLRGGKIL